jgi:hypothetical protein
MQNLIYGRHGHIISRRGIAHGRWAGRVKHADVVER